MSVNLTKEDKPAAIRHWHIATGQVGYGPDPGHSDYGTATDAAELCIHIREELKDSADAQGESAEGFLDLAKKYQTDQDPRELDALRDYVAAIELADELDNFARYYDADRANAPLYRDNPEKFTEEIFGTAATQFPMDIGDHNRLYVWECKEPDCEHLNDSEDEDEDGFSQRNGSGASPRD